MAANSLAAITPFKVIQNHRLWYQSKAYTSLLLVINANLPPILHRFQVMADYVINLKKTKFIKDGWAMSLHI